MNIKLIVVGKTIDDYLKLGENIYLDRLNHYTRISKIEVVHDKKFKGLPSSEQKKLEARQINKYIKNNDYVILLDVDGYQYKSEEFAKQMQKYMNQGIKNLLFIVGGAYGFDEEIIKRADLKLSLSKMTFSHQMVRVFFLEQLYRAFTILKGEPYHNR